MATGRVYEAGDEAEFADIPSVETDAVDMCMDEKDVYKELKLRGYHYRY